MPEPTGAVASQSTDDAGRRPEVQIGALIVLMLLVAVGCYLLTPDRDNTVDSGGLWAALTVLVLFPIAEYTVFNVQFRREGISFAFTEIPMAFALVFLTPLAAVLLRLPLSTLVLYFPRKNRGYKLAFNVTLYIVETALAVLVFRRALDALGSEAATVVVLRGAGSRSGRSRDVDPDLVRHLAVRRSVPRAVHERAARDLVAVPHQLGPRGDDRGPRHASSRRSPCSRSCPRPASGTCCERTVSSGRSCAISMSCTASPVAIGRTLDVDEIGDTAVDEIVGMLARRGCGARALHATTERSSTAAASCRVAVPDDPTMPGWSALLASGQVQVVDDARTAIARHHGRTGHSGAARRAAHRRDRPVRAGRRRSSRHPAPPIRRSRRRPDEERRRAARGQPPSRHAARAARVRGPPRRAHRSARPHAVRVGRVVGGARIATRRR